MGMNASAPVEVAPIKVTKSIESGALPVSCVPRYGDLYLLSKENQDMYDTGAGFAFIPHHDATRTMNPTAGKERPSSPHIPSTEEIEQLKNDARNLLESDSQPNLDRKDSARSSSVQKMELADMIQADNTSTSHVCHVTVTPGEDNPAHGKYICFIDHNVIS